MLKQLIPFIIGMIIFEILYFAINAKFKTTQKMKTRLGKKEKFLPVICVVCCFIIIFVVGAIGMYVIQINNSLFGGLCGALVGITSGIVTSMDK